MAHRRPAPSPSSATMTVTMTRPKLKTKPSPNRPATHRHFLTCAGLLALAIVPAKPSAQTSSQPPNATLGPPLRGHNPTDEHLLQTVKQQMTAQHWTGIRLFPTQSFPLLLEGQPAGVLVSGDAHQHRGESDKCFITLVEPGRPLVLLTTVEELQPANDIPACGSVRALGLLPSPNPAAVRIGVIYYINAPISGDAHGAISENEAVVLAFDRRTHQLTIDQPATDKAASASPENLPALTAALQP